MFKLKKALCTNCLLCMQACSWAHERPHQSLAFSRVRIEDDWPVVKTIGVCVACPKKPCIEVCDDDALSWDGYLRLDKDKCTQCMDCVDACTFKGIQVDPRDSMPLFCDTCEGEFNCVPACPTGAMTRMRS
ncbi:MAG: 4Fe-4S binding protein [Rhodospirillales bacterium]|nr:4Fe-4S binding protein [Rhodospirillales bacterium]